MQRNGIKRAKRLKINQNSTIAAITTPIGVGGVSIVRISGKKSVSIADKLFISFANKKPSEFKSRELILGTFKGKTFKENCLCVVFRNPNSFTGEDVVEFQCHGGLTLTNAIYSSLVEVGCTPATKGEFSKRAFLNGKISLDEAEGIIDIINAESESEIKVGYQLMQGCGPLSKFENCYWQLSFGLLHKSKVWRFLLLLLF